jgi:hypothetical protein
MEHLANAIVSSVGRRQHEGRRKPWRRFIMLSSRLSGPFSDSWLTKSTHCEATVLLLQGAKYLLVRGHNDIPLKQITHICIYQNIVMLSDFNRAYEIFQSARSRQLDGYLQHQSFDSRCRCSTKEKLQLFNLLCDSHKLFFHSTCIYYLHS